MTAVDPERRFTRGHPCPICGGNNALPQGKGVRCWGFLSADGDYAHCSRAEYAGPLPEDAAQTYAHRLTGVCRCGTEHTLTTPPVVNGHQPYQAPPAGSTTPRAERGEPIQETDYRYVTEDGEIVAIHRRFDYADESKSFAWLHPDGTVSRGEIKPENLPLYGLPELLAGERPSIVYFPEGERARDALAGLGVVAVACGGGSGQSRFGDAFAPLKGVTVVQLADNDAKGRTYMARAAPAMHAAGARTVSVELSGLPPGGDAVEWIASGGTKEKLIALVEAAMRPSSANGLHPQPIAAPDLLRKVFPEPRWAIPNVLPEGLAILGGRPKMGKSWLCLGLSVAVAAGGHAFGRIAVPQGEALHLGLEDGERRLQARIVAMLGADDAPPGLFLEGRWPRLDKGGATELRQWLTQHPDCRLVVIDTLAKIRPRRSSERQGYAEDYADAETLQQIAQEFRVAIVLVTHTRKAPADDFVDEISGTLGLSGGADAAFVLRRERGKPDATLSGTGRDLVEDVDFALVWDANLSGWSYAGSADEHRRSEERRAILRLLTEFRAPQTPKDVAEMLGKPYSTTRQTMWRMAQAGDLYAIGRGQYVVTPQREIVNEAANADERLPRSQRLPVT